MKYLILPLFAVVLMTSCGGSTTESSSNTDESAHEPPSFKASREDKARAKTLNITVPVVNSQFVGIIAGKLEDIDKNIELFPEETGTADWDGHPDFTISATQSIKVLGESDISSLYSIELDLLDENGVTIGSINSKYDDNKNLQQALNDGRIGKTFKVSFKSHNSMSIAEAEKLLKSVKQVAAGTSSGDAKAAGGKLKIKNANFSGPFADNIKLVEVGKLKVNPSALMIDDEDAASVHLETKVEVLEQSSKRFNECYLELLDADNNLVGKLSAKLAYDLEEAIKNGEVGSTINVEFWEMVKESEAQEMNEAVAVKAGSTK